MLYVYLLLCVLVVGHTLKRKRGANERQLRSSRAAGTGMRKASRKALPRALPKALRKALRQALRKALQKALREGFAKGFAMELLRYSPTRNILNVNNRHVEYFNIFHIGKSAYRAEPFHDFR